MQISNSTIFVPQHRVAEAQSIIQQAQKKAVADGWEPAGGYPKFTVVPAVGRQGQEINFDSPAESVNEVIATVRAIDELITVFKCAGNNLESVAKAIGNTVEDAAKEVAHFARKIWPF